MDQAEKQRLLDRNQQIVDMVIERVKRDFPDDIALIALTGSFSTGEFYEKSDLDLIIINNTSRAQKIASSFVLDDIGFDIYCTPWEPRIEAMADPTNPAISYLPIMEVLYCSKPEYLNRFNSYKNRSLAALLKPVGKECLERAKKSADLAKQHYADTVLSENMNDARHSAGRTLSSLTTVLAHLNNTYFKRGTRNRRAEVLTFECVPSDFKERFMAVVTATTVDEICDATHEILKSIIQLYHKMYDDIVERPTPSHSNIVGSYEELWGNYRNKIIAGCDADDKASSFLVATDAQDYLNEMTECRGTK